MVKSNIDKKKKKKKKKRTKRAGMRKRIRKQPTEGLDVEEGGGDGSAPLTQVNEVPII